MHAHLNSVSYPKQTGNQDDKKDLQRAEKNIVPCKNEEKKNKTAQEKTRKKTNCLEYE